LVNHIKKISKWGGNNMDFLQSISSYLATREAEMIAMLEELVNQDSGSSYKEGVNAIGAKMGAAFEGLGLNVEVVEQEKNGNHLVIKTKPNEKGGVLILGHMDTVFPKGTAAERPFTIKGDRAYGPGVSDMKAGLIAIYWALKAIYELGLDKDAPPLTIILNSDEERGSLSSRPLIEREGKEANYVLVAEPARANGAVVTARKGVGHFVLTSKGKAVHAGAEPENGINAIVDLAAAVLEIHQLNDFAKGTTFNSGVIQGGTASNVVPDYAAVEIDIRAELMEEAERAVESLQLQAKKQFISGAERTLTGEINRPPMEKLELSQELYQLACQLAEKIGFDLPEAMSGGGSDGNFTAALGIATLDGLGPVGGGFHSANEYLELTSIVPRTTLLAGLMLSLQA
jgi:glutamate carboxypeptidase